MDAPFNARKWESYPPCLAGTRVELLQDINNWADGHDERSIFWLNGLAGTGKSTIARTVARTCYQKQRLGASFFFSRGGGDVGHADKFVTSIVFQLAISIPTLRRHVCDAIKQHVDIASQSLHDQWQQLVLNPLSKLDSSSGKIIYILVVDALDECEDEDDLRLIFRLLAEAPSLEKVRLRVFLTSRPEVPVRYGILEIPEGQYQDFVLHNISSSTVNRDINIFLSHHFKLIVKEVRSLKPNWPGEDIFQELVQIASGLFIWAATACRFIREGKQFAAKRLDLILKGSESAVKGPEKHLNEIYITVLKHSVSPGFDDVERKEFHSMLRKILGSVVTLFSQLSVQSLSTLLCLQEEKINETLEDLHSILDMPKNQAHPLRLHHPSFRDFLLNNNRCTDSNFCVDKTQAHQLLADKCIRLMSTSLKQDICGVGAPGMRVADIDSRRIEQSLPPEMQYACCYWIQHLRKSGSQLSDNDQVHRFLQEHLLHWLEALGWMRKVTEGIHAIITLDLMATVSQTVRKRAYEANRRLSHRSVPNCPTLSVMLNDSPCTAGQRSSRLLFRHIAVRLHLHPWRA